MRASSHKHGRLYGKHLARFEKSNNNNNILNRNQLPGVQHYWYLQQRCRPKEGTTDKQIYLGELNLFYSPQQKCAQSGAEKCAVQVFIVAERLTNSIWDIIREQTINHSIYCLAQTGNIEENFDEI